MPHAKVSDQRRTRSKQIRTVMTPAETLLWRHIKAHRIDGWGFRRQVHLQNYIADFVCIAAKLTVELDGESHDFEQRQQADRSRDAFFVSEDFQILRFTNDEVMSNLEGVVEMIRQMAVSRLRGSPLSPPLPHRGGGSRRTQPPQQIAAPEFFSNRENFSDATCEGPSVPSALVREAWAGGPTKAASSDGNDA